MATTTSPNIGPRVVRTSNTPLYWGVAILAAVIIILALLMRPDRVATPTVANDTTATAQRFNTTPETRAFQSTQVDPTTGAIIQNESNPTYDANRAPTGSDARVKGMATDPRAEQIHNGANSPNGGIAPNNNPASQSPKTKPSQY